MKSDLALSQQGYRRLAPAYDLVFGASLAPGRRAALAALACRPGDRVLEVCVGTGMSLPLYPPQVRVTGIDASREMLARAAARVAARRLSQVEALLQMDAGRLAFADASFDKVALMFALSGLPDPLRAVREMRRVCRPGGTIVIVQHFRSASVLLRACELLLAPTYRVMRYRADMDLVRFLAAAMLDVVETRRTNLFGYATLLTCVNRVPQRRFERQRAAGPAALSRP
ncbi:MAG TPA: methyltransferase domain-containing protein [Burkholderiales bacterium]|nr:methyltransferase domain-containing protein [Burkholderiales bacterium]